MTDDHRLHRTVRGPADLKIERGGDIAVVLRIDCRRCQGGVVVTQPDRMSPLGAVNAPFRAAYLLAVSSGDADRQIVNVRARGTWTVSVSSWNALSSRTGTVSGTGSDVIRLADEAPGVRVRCRPKTTEECHVRVFSDSGDVQLVGDDTMIDETVEARLPAVIAVTTNGTWTLRRS